MSALTTSLTLLLRLATGTRTRDERGLSQSTENAILLAGTMLVD